MRGGGGVGSPGLLFYTCVAVFTRGVSKLYRDFTPRRTRRATGCTVIFPERLMPEFNKILHVRVWRTVFKIVLHSI